MLDSNRTRQGYARKRILKPAGHFLGIAVSRPFTKPPVTYQDQVSLLQSRGMQIQDPVQAAFYLQQLNYYRLAAYWLPFEADHATHTFRSGTRFEDVLNLYVFDRELRLLVLDAIERIEVSIRGQWAYQLAHRHGPHAHLDATLAKDPRHGSSNLAQLTDEVMRSKESYIQHLLATYSEPLPPVWAVCETMSLGLLSRLYTNIKPVPTRRAIASNFGVDEQVLESWLRHLALLRNTCAHHSRLWNREFAITPMLPRRRPAQVAAACVPASRRVYNSLVIIIHLMDLIAPNHHWRDRLKSLIAQHDIGPASMGFPVDWAQRDIWRKVRT